MTLRLGTVTFADDATIVMGIVNRTPDSFFDRGASFAEGAALERARVLVAEGAGVLDVGGVKAGHGAAVDAAEEIRRVVPFVARLRAEHPGVAISVDTWRAEVADAACAEGADLVNDAWGGTEPRVAAVAAKYGAGYVCTHVGGQRPRTDPHRVSYPDVVASVVADVTALAERAVAAGVPRESVLVDPAHDFGKNTRHSLRVTRCLGELVATGWPVLVAVSNKDFVGETLDRPTPERLTGTLAATAVCARLGARMFRAHQVAETRALLDEAARLEAAVG